MSAERWRVWELRWGGQERAELQAEAGGQAALKLDSAAWFEWLEDQQTSGFSYPIYNAEAGYIEAFITLRRERRTRGGQYWVAYGRVGGRLCKRYLGASSKLSWARLGELAAWYLAERRSVKQSQG